MPTVVKLAVARHGARADDDPLWASSDSSARLWDPPLSEIGREQASSLGDFAASLGVTRLVVSPFTRCLQTAAAVARKILEKAAEEGKGEEEEEEEEAAEAATEEAPAASNANGPRRLRRPCAPPPLAIEVDASVCEVLSRDCMGGRDPPDGADPGLWAWGASGSANGSGSGSGSESEEAADLERRLLSAAAAAGLPPQLTSLVVPRRSPSSEGNKPLFASYPETRGEAGTRYLIALASAAARALAAAAAAGAEEEEEEEGGGGGGADGGSENPSKKAGRDGRGGSGPSPSTPPPITMVVTHGEAVVAATRMTAKRRGEPYTVPPTGVVVLDVFLDDDGDDGGKDRDCDGDGDGADGNASALAAAASAVACARWELSEAARGVAFE